MSDFVPVYVRTDHLQTVMRFVASLLSPPTVPGTNEWPDDVLQRLYNDSAESTLAVLLALARRPGEWIGTDELAKALGPDAGWRSVAGAINPLTKRQKMYGQQTWPVNLRQDPATERWLYSMSERTAKVLLDAHEMVERVIAEIQKGGGS
jgi:hypothetical protein